MIPDGWKKVPISEFLIIKHGKSQKDVVITSGGFPILGSGGEIGRARKPLYEKESVLIGRKGTINKPVFINEPFWTIDTLFYSEIKPKRAFPKWVFYEFCYRNWMEYNEASGVPSLNAKTISSIQTLLPPLPEQIKIADILTSVDEAIQATQKVIEQSEKVKQGLLQELLTKGIGHTEFKKTEFGEIPVEWEKMSLVNAHVLVIDGDRGKEYPKADEFSSKGYSLFLNAGNVTKNGFLFTDNYYITEGKDRKLRKGKLKREDVIITTRGTIGNVAYYSSSIKIENLRINSGMAILRSLESKILPQYLYQFMKSPIAKTIINNLSFGSAQPQITIKILNNLVLPIPSTQEQQDTVEIFSSVDESIQKSKDKKTQLEQIKKGLMQDLLTGKVRVKV